MAALTALDKNGVRVVYFDDAKILDEAHIQKVGDELIEQTTRAVDGKLLLNFQNVTFMSSAMIGKLNLLRRKCENDQIKLKFCNITANLMEVFKITNLNKIFDIQKDEEKAIKSFDKKGWFG